MNDHEKRIVELLRKIPEKEWPKLGYFLAALAEDDPQALDLLQRGDSGEIDFRTALDIFESDKPA